MSTACARWGLLGAGLAFAFLGCKRKTAGIEALPDYDNGVLMAESYMPKSGLLKIHYPAELVANPESESLTFLEPLRAASLDPSSIVTFTTNADPVSKDAGEYARVLQGARGKVLTGYRLLSTTPGHCFKGQDGVETRWEFSETTTRMQGRACAFIHNKHGYSFMYAFKPNRPEDEAKLRKVVDSTELLD